MISAVIFLTATLAQLHHALFNVAPVKPSDLAAQQCHLPLELATSSFSAMASSSQTSSSTISPVLSPASCTYLAGTAQPSLLLCPRAVFQTLPLKLATFLVPRHGILFTNIQLDDFPGTLLHLFTCCFVTLLEWPSFPSWTLLPQKMSSPLISVRAKIGLLRTKMTRVLDLIVHPETRAGGGG